ncbi:MAG: CoA pyrophosphatase [Pseudohongiellaceae bacterium]|nr:CoA pyrophosphatase [Pseudohongiellaceae bacterium]
MKYAPSNKLLHSDIERKLREHFERPHDFTPPAISHAPEFDKSALADTIHYRIASVLVPIYLSAGTSSIVLTLRTAHLNSHAGQISFPGGTREEHDNSAIDTALRETEEEIGIKPKQVEVLGSLGGLRMPSGYHLTPIVGLLNDISQIAPCPREVAEVIHLPLEQALDLSNYRSMPFKRAGFNTRVWEIYIGEHRVWGATATILRHLAEELNLSL